MNKAKRIAIIGNAGSGKSTLAQKLSIITHLPVYHLDQYFWGPNWTHPDLAEYVLVHDALCDKEEWIIDGMNLRFLLHRIERADVIIFLDFPRYVCFWRIFKRMLQYYGKETPSSAQGCPERLNWEFVRFLKWVWRFKANYPARINELLLDYASEKQVYVFKSQQELDQFLKTYKV
jgi:adenylate kinase family enzyme